MNGGSVAFVALAALCGLVLLAPWGVIAARLVLRRPVRGLETLLLRLADLIDALNDRIGRAVSWLTLAMVLVQTLVVLQRYIFGVGQIWLQESVTYMHGLVFMLAAGYTLLHGGHVRVDIFYREASLRTKAVIDFLGCYLFIFPVMAIILTTAYPYVRLSWLVREGSTETSGIQGVYLLKSIILVFAVLVILQGLSLAVRTALRLTGERKSELEAEGPTQIF